jgi:hypothetical protein
VHEAWVGLWVLCFFVARRGVSGNALRGIRGLRRARAAAAGYRQVEYFMVAFLHLDEVGGGALGF